MTRPALQFLDLTKTYGKRRGVEQVSFDVQRGEVFGFLGPNGAGKTTAMRVLMDLLRPTSGSASVLGLDSHTGRDEIHARTGYLPGEMGLLERERVREQLRDLADMRGGRGKENIESLAHRLDLDLQKPLRALSRGNKQKVGLVQAFMHEPELLILDEPTSGLDPLMQQQFNKLVQEARAAGRTVFLSSHVLPEVEHLCDRVAIIREGRILTVSTVAEIKSRAVRHVEVRLRQRAPEHVLRDAQGVNVLVATDHAIQFQVQGELGDALALLTSYGIRNVVTREPTLEDVFLGYYSGGENA